MNQFRLSAFPLDDFDTTIVRIEKSKMKELGLKDGDTIKITGVESTGAQCYSVEDGFEMANDSEITYLSSNPVILPKIRVSNLVGQNINRLSAGLIPVKVEKIFDGTRPANRVCLMSRNSNLDNSNFEKEKLHGLIVCKNNRLTFRDENPNKNFGFHVSSVEPSDFAQITKDTLIEFVKTEPAAIHSSFTGPSLERLQKVVPVEYQETLNNVDVLIPSLEVFDSGIRFYLYIKSKFSETQPVPNGHASVFVTLEDDLGNSYVLSGHGGGGSHSPGEFEYKHDFHGKLVSKDANQLTITLHEILIQEQFPRHESHARAKPILQTKFDYSAIEKFPSFYIISGPWKAEFTISN